MDLPLTRNCVLTTKQALLYLTTRNIDFLSAGLEFADGLDVLKLQRVLLAMTGLKKYTEPTIAPCSLKMVTEISQKLGLQVPEEELHGYVESVNKVLKSAEVVHNLAKTLPEVQYPRLPGYRPPAEENPYNAWYIKTVIKGAASGILAGKTIVIKDNVAVAGVPMMNGSRMFEGHVPDYDATVVTRILQHGGTIVGKSTCENLCCSGNSFTSATGPVLNPHDRSRSSGGSSSGSAVLIATGEADMAIGTDLGGSIRVPASWCGIVGLKPTHSLVPHTGAIGIYPPMDHVGPMAKNVTDCALLLQLNDGVEGLKIGILKEGLDNCKDEVIKGVMNEAVTRLKREGALVEEVTIPYHKIGKEIVNAEQWRIKNRIQKSQSSFLVQARVGDIFPHIGTPGYYDSLIKGGIYTGLSGWHDVALAQKFQAAFSTQSQYLPASMKLTCVLAEVLKQQDNFITFAKAENCVPLIRKAYDDVLRNFDVLLLPTTPYLAPLLPLVMHSLPIQEFMDYALGMTTNTSPFNMTGHPALSLNASTTNDKYLKLPVGMMIVGKHFDEATVLRVARAYEKISTGK